MSKPITYYTQFPFWQIDWSPDKFSYCMTPDGECRYSAEHDWRCDGQFFFKPRKKSSQRLSKTASQEKPVENAKVTPQEPLHD